ncbi:MAG: YbaB/EbfC family nucleoid-associated protein [Candidatus Parcubacteria bacterium]|nr:YbaB/EbfC family nucleoid-associated protein [Candidatus Paceibacterota bacterium]
MNPIKMQQQHEKLKKLLSSIIVTGTSKNGKVTVTINGEQKIQTIDIDPALIEFVYENFIKEGKPDALLGKAIIEAFEKAVEDVQKAVVTQLQQTGGINDLMGMLKDAGNI